MSQLLTCSKSDTSGGLRPYGLSRNKSVVWAWEGINGSYKKLSRVIFAIFFLLTLLLMYFSLMKTYVDHALLPSQNSVFPWVVSVMTDQDVGGASTITIKNDASRLDYAFWIAKKAQNPYVTLALSFAADTEEKTFVDLSKYSQLSFNVRCSPQNVLTLVVNTFDNRVANSSSPAAYPIPSRYFSCNETFERISIDLRDLEIPDWWLHSMRKDLSNRDYSLGNVMGLAFAISPQSPMETQSRVVIDDLVLHGRDWHLLYLVTGLVLLVWVGSLFGFLRAWPWLRRTRTPNYSSVINDDVHEQVPHAYQKLVWEPQRDKQKTAILQFMATEYANPDISLESASASLGINRNKINEILKQEQGLTFTSYLNKLRLTEAARLLAEKEAANIAEVAYSVGYNNVPYFNKLFKSEYSCTPKAYKTAIQSKSDKEQ
jgi:AraC-like DNA-binding protein